MYISIRDAVLMAAGEGAPVESARTLGVDAFEIELGNDFSVCALDSRDRAPLADTADAEAYGGHLRGLGVKPAALLTARDFSAGDPKENAAWVARAIELADAMGAPCVRIDSAMSRERELDFERRVHLFAEGLGAALRQTEGSRVTLGIENHGFQGNNLAFQLNVYEMVGSDRLGSTLDTGNFYWRGYPLSEVYGILMILAPYARHTHLKNINYPEEVREKVREAGWEYGKYVSPLDEGDIDHAKVLRMLANAGYDGDICIEDESLRHYEGPDERMAVLKRDVEHVRGILDELD